MLTNFLQVKGAVRISRNLKAQCQHIVNGFRYFPPINAGLRNLGEGIFRYRCSLPGLRS